MVRSTCCIDLNIKGDGHIVVFRHLHFQVHCIEKKLQHNLSKITKCAFGIDCCWWFLKKPELKMLKFCNGNRTPSGPSCVIILWICCERMRIEIFCQHAPVSAANKLEKVDKYCFENPPRNQRVESVECRRHTKFSASLKNLKFLIGETFWLVFTQFR